MKILVADDSLISQRIIQITLERLGFEVITAENGKDAWDILQKENVRLVIADWVMPVMDGIALCNKIRSSEKAGYVYFILLTSKDDKTDIIEGLKAGADDYITKPFEADELTLRVRNGERVLRLERELKEEQEKLLDLNRKLEELALIDPLLEIGNRRSFYERIESIHNLTCRKVYYPSSKHENSYGLIMCDIDHFKSFNDTYGHMKGDQVLKTVAESIKNSIRVSDEVSRFGGEEIVIIVPEQDLEGTVYVAEKIREKIEELGIEHKGADKGILTISCGVSVFNIEDKDNKWEAILDRADKALYRSKSLGRNTVCSEGNT
jgi:diguanylate cyclase (GGDEF)-like protein